MQLKHGGNAPMDPRVCVERYRCPSVNVCAFVRARISDRAAYTVSTYLIYTVSQNNTA